MAYETGATGLPVIMPGGGDGMFGGGSIGALLIGALLFGGGLGGFGGRGVAGADLAATAGLQNQINGLQNQLTAQGTSSEINELESAVAMANTANLQGIANNAQIYAQGNAALNTAIASSNFTTLNSINGLGRDVTAAFNQGTLQTLNSFNNLNTTMLQGFNEVGRDTAAGINQLVMGQNAIASKMQECCCDIRSTILADGNATRALINDLNTQNLNTQIADLKSQVNTNAIINALRPVTV